MNTMDVSQMITLQDALPATDSLQNMKDVCNDLPLVGHVEVLRNPYSTGKTTHVEEKVKEFLSDKKVTYGETVFKDFTDEFLFHNVESIIVCDMADVNIGLSKRVIDLCSCTLKIHVFQMHTDGAGCEMLEEEEMSAASHWLLPSSDFQGLWDSLVYDEPIKMRLLNYASTTLLFSDHNVNSSIISWNRVILLHGPPGTGKTSLCKALAQKLCIRLSDRYSHGQLVEINSHSLFSKWFSESGKLVMKMFQKIQDYMEDPQALICVLIDEVESLTAARKSAMNGMEPSDAIRVVNAMLTQLDQIKKYPNVLILTTSNITGAIDLAFVDRADIKQFVGHPSTKAIYSIYLSCLTELMKCGVISPTHQLVDVRSLEITRFIENSATHYSLKLFEIASKSQGLSGRALRKIPFIAHAMYLKGCPITLDDFLQAMTKAVERQFKEQEDLTRD